MRGIFTLSAGAAAVGVSLAVAGTAGAAFQETFDDGNASARFTTASINNPAIDYGYDYSAAGIPSAPNSSGTTVGLRMAARTGTADAAGAVAAVRNNFTITSDYTMSFDMWINYNGGAGGGAGSTEYAYWGLNNTGSGILANQFTGGTAQGYAFAATGEGGSASDYRIYYTDASDDGSQYPKANATWFAPVGDDLATEEPDNHFNDFYDGDTDSDGVADAPGLFSTNETIGAPGKSWVHVVISQVGNSVTYSFNGTNIATLNLAEAADGDGAAYLSYGDIFTGSVPDSLPDSFVVFDNLAVTVPEPGSLALLGLGGLFLGRRRRA